jgi:hypothetical protein
MTRTGTDRNISIHILCTDLSIRNLDKANIASNNPSDTEIAIDINDTVMVGISPFTRNERFCCPTLLKGDTANQPQV